MLDFFLHALTARSMCCNAVAMITFCIVNSSSSSSSLFALLLLVGFGSQSFFFWFSMFRSDDACNFIMRSAFSLRRYHHFDHLGLQWHHYNGSLFIPSRIQCAYLLILAHNRFAIINKLTRKKCFTCRESLSLTLFLHANRMYVLWMLMEPQRIEKVLTKKKQS